MDEPTPKEIVEFLVAFSTLESFEASHRHIRGYGAFREEDCPIPAVQKVVMWLSAKARQNG